MKQPRFLTHVLARAVPHVPVDYVEVVAAGRVNRTVYLIEVNPRHHLYWRYFKKAYPHWIRVAHRYRVLGPTHESFCPEFSNARDLLSWLFDVLNLTHGERSLLQICGVDDVKVGATWLNI